MTLCFRPRVRTAVLSLFAILLAGTAAAQTPPPGRPAGRPRAVPSSTPGVSLAGRIVDAADRSPMAGANVTATRLSADSLRTGAATDSTGAFRFGVPPGRYRIRVSSVGYLTVTRAITVPELPAGVPGITVPLGDLALVTDAVALRGITVEGVQARATVRGDTTAFNADAFKVQRDATTEDLVAKLPGVTVENGQVTAQGERVRRVLVDGREFFGDDPTAALRNLPADAVQEIQVFDRASDQSRFTGFDDGNRERTINVVTRPNRRNGRFGRLNAGAGADAQNAGRARYTAGGSVNAFKGERRLTVVGLLNNVNQQNFAFEDLIGAAGAGGAGGGGGRGGAGGVTIMRMEGGGPPGGGGFRFGGGGGGGVDPSAFLGGERGGINAVGSLGLNGANKFGRAQVSGSYFLNRTANTTQAQTTRDYLIPEGARYAETNDADGVGYSHRLNGRVEMPFTDRTELTFTPRLSLQTNRSTSALEGLAALSGGNAQSRTRNDYRVRDLAYTSNTNALFRHRFPRAGRSVSANVGLSFDGRGGDTDQSVTSTFFGDEGASPDSTSDYRRDTDADSWGRTLSFRLAYTEPVGRRAQLQASYNPAFARSAADQDAALFDAVTGGFTTPDPAFTSRLDRRVSTHRGGLSLQYRRDRTTASIGLDAQAERLDVQQTGGRAYNVARTFTSILPAASFRYQPSRTSNVDVNYRASTNAPSATQLRSAYDDTNPLLVTVGNPDLRPSTSHSLDARVRAVRAQGAQVLAVFASVTRTADYVANAVLLPRADTLVAPGVTIGAGSQLSFPVNVDGYVSARSFLTYGRPLGFFRSNANATLGLNFTRTPGLVNDARNRADAASVDGRLSVTSNVSERLDFNAAYGVSFTNVTNTARVSRDQRYARHRPSARLTARPRGGFVFTTDLTASFYTGQGVGGAAPSTAVWNAGLGYTFLANEAAEVRLSVNDLLDRNTNVSRSTQGAYVETSESEALGRYVMLNLTYRIRQAGGRGAGRPGEGPAPGTRVFIPNGTP